jgi:hypothetical protein
LRLVKDILLHFPASIPGVLLPFWSSKTEDELCLLNPKNIISLFLHTILIFAQVLFCIALPGLLLIPIPVFAAAYLSGIALFLTLNFLFCKLLNGDGTPQISDTDLSAFPRHDNECWVFINGVSVGRDWFQCNLNTLSLIFRRPIIGVHNITYGIIFDILECLIQRNACYATNDIRTGYAQAKKRILDEKNEKIVLIVHSQGGIEAGAILDWLLADLPSDKLARLEIYTFGSAANHFNNPNRINATSKGPNLGVLKYIEHYTNSGDFVAQFGILGFIRMLAPSSPAPAPAPTKKTSNKGNNINNGDKIQDGKDSSNTTTTTTTTNNNNRFRGRLFKRNATGHMLTQHYLAYMFPREPCTLPDGTPGERVADTNAFMDTVSSSWDGGPEAQNLGWKWPWRWGFGFGWGEEKAWESMVQEDGADLSGGERERRPRELSRLWEYRNGGVPVEDLEEERRKKEEEAEEEKRRRRENRAKRSEKTKDQTVVVVETNARLN